MDALDQIAQKIAWLYKAVRSIPNTAPRVGTVVSLKPLQIQWGESVVLTSNKLIVAEHLMPGYTRNVELTDLQMSGLDDNHQARIGFLINDVVSESRIASLKIPKIENLNSIENRVRATIAFTDGLGIGDKVILQPDESMKQWYVTGRVWKEPVAE
ncbi:MAG TPA: DUF2577 family protein [Brevibacillus sp.]|nr:DUF2577 family protein [Brevibacillus sp.]